MTLSVFAYTDFRKFLRDAYAERKRADRKLTYRGIAEIAGFKSPGFFTQIIQGKTNISPAMESGLARAFKLNKREREYFGCLVEYGQCSTHEEKKNAFRKILGFREAQLPNLSPEHFELFDKWYYTAVLAALSYLPFRDDYAGLAKTLAPPITRSQARQSIELLERMGLIARDSEGMWALTKRNLSTGLFTDSPIVNSYLLNSLDISKDALYRFPKPSRSFSSLALSVSSQGYRKIKEATDAFRATIIDIVKEDRDMDRVYQLNIQLFPTTVLPEHEEE
jgi:uncharacterized protein (TIGR02147 family)